MVSVGSVELGIKLGLAQLLKDADTARLALQKQLQDQKINLDLVTGPASAKLSQLSADILKAKAAASDSAGEAAGLQQQAATLQEMLRYKRELADIEGSGLSDEDVTNAKALAAELNKLNLDRIEAEFNDLQKEIAQTEKQGGSFIGKLNQQAAAFQDAVSKSSQYTQALSVASAQLGQLGEQINNFTQQAGQAAIAFDSARAKVATLSNDADGLADRMRTLSEELGYQSNSTDLLNASYDVLSSGISDTAEIAGVLKASTQGALGGFSDVGTVSDAVTTLISAYKSMGASASDAQKFVDILAQTQDKGKITIGQYAGQIGQVASTAALAGVSVEEMSAAIATATAKGQDSGGAISGVRQAIVNLLKPTDEAAKYLKKFGIENSAAMLKTEGLVGILERLKKGGATTDELAKIFSDVTGLATVATLANENLGDFKTNLDAMGNSAGKAALSAEKVANSMQGQLTAASNQANEALVDLGNGVTKAFVPLLKALTFLVENFNKLPTPVKESIGLIIALSGGLITLGAALAGIAAVAPSIVAGLGLMGGAAITTTGALTGGAAGMAALSAAATAALPALAALLPVLAVIAAGVGAIKFVMLVKEMGDANAAIDAATKGIQANADGAFAAANRTQNAVTALTKAKQSGRVLTAGEIQDAQKLVKANELRLSQLKEDLALAEALPAANEAQAQSKQNLITQTKSTIAALEGQNGKLNALLPTNAKVAASNTAVANSLETVTEKYQNSTAELEAANKLRQAEIAESVAQGLKTEEEAREQSLEQERKYLGERLKTNQDKLAELKALKDVTKDPEKLKELNTAILQAEQQLSDDRLAVAQSGIAQRQAAEEKALKDLQKKITDAQNGIVQSKTDRTIGVKQDQASGAITDEQAATEIAKIEQDSIKETIELRRFELAENQRLKAEGRRSAEEAAAEEIRLTQEIGSLTIEQINAEIAARKAADEERQRIQGQLIQDIQDGAKQQADTATLAAQNQITAIKQAQLAGVTSAEEAAKQIAEIQANSIDEGLRIKEEELARIQELQDSGRLTTKEKIEEAANYEKSLIKDIAGLKQQAVEADIAATEQAKQAKITAIEQQAEVERVAVEVRQGQAEIERQALETQNNLYSAQSALLQAQTGLRQQRLQNAIEEAEANGQTNKAEELKKKLIAEQIRAQEQQARIETAQLRLQQEMNKYKLEESQRTAEIAVREAQIELTKARINGASAQEIANLQAILGLRGDQLNALNNQAAAQQKINAMESQALAIKQQQTKEALAQANIKVNSGTTNPSGGGAHLAQAGEKSSGFSGGGGSFNGFGQPPDVMSITDKLTDLGNAGDLSTAFQTANLGLKLKLGGLSPGGLGSSAPAFGGAGNGEILGKLDQMIAATKASGGRPNLSISNVNDLGLAGMIYGDISRDSFRGAGL